MSELNSETLQAMKRDLRLAELVSAARMSVETESFSALITAYEQLQAEIVDYEATDLVPRSRWKSAEDDLVESKRLFKELAAKATAEIERLESERDELQAENERVVGENERLKQVVDAAVEWRRIGYERKDEFDIYDVGHKRPCEEL